MSNHTKLRKVLGPGNFSRLSRKSGVSRPHVSRVLRGIKIKHPSAEVLEKLSKASGLPLKVIKRFVDIEKALRGNHNA